MSTNKEIAVVKFGSKCLVDDNGNPNMSAYRRYADGISTLKQGYDVAIVTSGALAMGKSIVRETWRRPERFEDSTLSGLGSSAVFENWRAAFHARDRFSVGTLITHHELTDRVEGRRLKERFDSLRKAFYFQAVYNANDALEDKELAKEKYGGDNDGLAAHLAVHLGASRLLLLTTVDGFIKDGEVMSTVAASDVESLRPHLHPPNEEGTGSMESKLIAGGVAATAGIRSFIANALHPVYEQALNGQNCTEVLQ